MSTSVLGELPLIPSVSSGGDSGVPVVLASQNESSLEVQRVMKEIARKVYLDLELNV